MNKVETLALFLEQDKKSPILDLYGVYTGNRQYLWVRLSGKLLKRRASYWRHVNIILPENTNYNNQC